MNVDDIKERYVSRDAKVFARDNTELRLELQKQMKEFERKNQVTICQAGATKSLMDFKEHLKEQAITNQQKRSYRGLK